MLRPDKDRIEIDGMVSFVAVIVLSLLTIAWSVWRASDRLERIENLMRHRPPEASSR